ncbi:phytanoyl-CoA dioxygenase [Alphaproteobacteria bacterium HT1-32]|nr:phytanoyl-CoA dioxygenase [Alphaproteobacteria bacterium HT1-32]
MPKYLSDQQVSSYQEQGFVSPVNALTAEQTAHYRARFEAYEAANDGWYELSKGQKLHLLQTWVCELATNSVILDAVEDVLGPDIFCWATSLFIKDAGTTNFVSWHQDSTYWGLSKPDVVTAWVALSPANRVSGCMKMWPGSQKMDQMEHVDTLSKDNLLTRGQEVAVAVPEAESVLCELDPGQISLHNIRTVHASEPNRSDDRRIGVAIRYIAPDVHQIHAAEDSAMLVRGEDRYGNFIHEAQPKADMDAAARAEHARIMELRQGVLYKGVQGKPAHLEKPAG